MSKPTKTYASIRIYSDLKDSLDNLKIQSGGVEFDSYDDKIRHLLWHFTHYKNNNGA